MKPESTQFLAQAQIMLERATIMLQAGLNEDAARAAYMASFHLAQGYIFERTEKLQNPTRVSRSNFSA